MTVKELIKQLQELPQNFQVIMSKDGEGNSYSPLSSVHEVLYRPDSTYSGELVYLGDDDDDDIDEEDIQEREEDDQDAICFWPVN